LSILTNSSKKLKLFEPYPQISYNVPKLLPDLLIKSNIIECIKDMEQYLGDCGRVIVRESGTENVIRIMTECEDEAKARYATSTIKQILSGNYESSDDAVCKEQIANNIPGSTLLDPPLEA